MPRDIQGIGVLPSTADRNASITPPIGFNIRSQPYLSPMRLVGYITGVANIHIWTRKGMAYCTSLYLTFRAENHRPNPRAFIMVIRARKGTRNIPALRFT